MSSYEKTNILSNNNPTDKTNPGNKPNPGNKREEPIAGDGSGDGTLMDLVRVLLRKLTSTPEQPNARIRGSSPTSTSTPTPKPKPNNKKKEEDERNTPSL